MQLASLCDVNYMLLYVCVWSAIWYHIQQNIKQKTAQFAKTHTLRRFAQTQKTIIVCGLMRCILLPFSESNWYWYNKHRRFRPHCHLHSSGLVLVRWWVFCDVCLGGVLAFSWCKANQRGRCFAMLMHICKLSQMMHLKCIKWVGSGISKHCGVWVCMC